ncbi:MAG: valine--tRNA ligase [Acidimicrobiia bacterium]|nr:valine--tRNA ligase [Acidimicrobiia bacterium]NNF70032.1 valine--tRNA ligase [Acidimicrobiia bacterium]
MQSSYEPNAVEARWYPIWEESGVFKPEVNPDGEPFTISIPPPNVTGSLHMGHALNLSMQDVVIRRRRMQGYAALWVPGMDHAGIATQNVVERQLAVEGISRHDIGRDKFVEEVWAWKAKSGNRITEQIRTLGMSCDWSRERFTLDDGLSKAVREVFVTLYEEGLIYRGNRIINWCPRCHTALSDIEVEHRDEMGEMVHIAYPYTEGDGAIIVATTRAETMLGDAAVAVHPDDERYAAVVGKTVTLPLVGRQIPVVADDGVDPEFGTGAVKVTPAHDPLDFEIGQRHDLDPITIMDAEGRITTEGGQFVGLDRFDAREAVKTALQDSGALIGIEDHEHSVGHCSRCSTVIEPRLSLQWFVKVKPLVEPAIDAIKADEARFHPKRWEKNYFHWMENLRDWCISRQLWWGHRIPAWYCECGEVVVSRIDPEACPACDSTDLTPEEDVLDTWFSSALWPFSTLGWPEKTADVDRHYPTSVMITGYDIIYFWVARMLKMGIHFTGQVPFPDIVIHGLVRADDGRKMSKSLNNAVDPLDLAAEYGADALRLSLIQSAAPGHEVPFKVEWVDAARRFGNKLWNALRFAVEHIGISDVPATGGYPEDPGPVDAWILSRLHDVVEEYDAAMERYRFNDAVGLLYSFSWSEVFDWYLEMAKTPLRDEDSGGTTRQTLGVVLRDLLKLFHPIIPFLTEELWSELVGEGLVAGSSWPTPPKVAGPEAMPVLQDLVSGIRRFRSEHGVSPKVPLEVRLDDPESVVAEWWADQISVLAGAAIVPGGRPDPIAGNARIPAGSVEGFVALSGVIDVDAERPRIEKAIAAAEAVAGKSRAKLDNPAFRDKAPEAVVAKEQAKLDEIDADLQRLREQLAELG